MAVRLRLTRVGSRKNPIWRVVAADGRAKRDGRVLETVGRYNPQSQPSEIVLDRERIDHWLARGAQPSNTVRKLIRASERGAPPASASASAPATATAPPPAADEGTSDDPPADDAGPTAGGDESAPAAEAEPSGDTGTEDEG